MQAGLHRLRLHVHPALLIASLVAATPPLASAQVTARNFQELGLRVRPGDTVYITVDSGNHEQEARVIEVMPSLLRVSLGGVRRNLSESDVSRIRQRRPDSRKNGTLLGALVGASGTTAGAVTMASPSGSCKGACVAVNVAYGGGIGALAGFGLDSLRQPRRDIYVRADGRSARTVDVQPLALRTARGLRVSLRW